MTRRAGRSPASLPAPLQTNRGQQTQLPCGPRATPGDVALGNGVQSRKQLGSDGGVGRAPVYKGSLVHWYVRSRF
jgi:hypothetical protein